MQESNTTPATSPSSSLPESSPTPPKKKRGCCFYGVVAFGSLVLLSLLASLSGNHSETNQPVVSTTGSTVQPQPTPTATQPQYEIISENPSGQLDRLIVYTSKTEDAQLIAINDELVKKNLGGYLGITDLFINYFDDATVAKTYFQDIGDDSISEAKKNELFTHFIATMTYNSSTGFKELQLTDSHGGKTLKSY